jgi:hypothetical protein
MTKMRPHQRKATSLFVCACVGLCAMGLGGTNVGLGKSAGGAILKGVPSDVPLPPVRPHDLQTPPDKETVITEPVPTPGDNDALREQVLASGKIIGESLPMIAEAGGCGILAPLRLEAIVLVDGAKVAIMPPVVLRASLAVAVADWLREDLEPALAAKSDRLDRIEGTGAYECRSRNRIAGAKLSEHAIGNAFDLHAFVTSKGRRLAVAAATSTEADGNQAFFALVKATACRRFMTVLGPGSDGFHAEHLHIDLEDRRSGAHLCQWNLPPAPTDVATPAPVSAKRP